MSLNITIPLAVEALSICSFKPWCACILSDLEEVPVCPKFPSYRLPPSEYDAKWYKYSLL